jgi:Catalytic LigB subunit of aromatic ring-opening dioxygenase
MPVVFACAASHAPGMTAWTEAAPKEQADRFLGCYRQLGDMLAASQPDALVAITVEHWANFFLNQMPAFCIGRADHYDGPVEEWLRIPKARVPGDSELGAELLDACLDGGFDPTFSDELLFDHVAFSQSEDGRSCDARYHQHPDGTDAVAETMLRLRRIYRQKIERIKKTSRRHCHRRSVPLAGRSEARKNQHSFRQEVSRHLDLRRPSEIDRLLS